MRQTTFALFVSLLLAATLTTQAQENKTPAQQVTAPTTTIEKPKNEVEKMIAKAEARGEQVVLGCPDGCEENDKGPGVLNGKAISLPIPAYPPIARAAHAEGIVDVQVLIDYDGRVIAAAVINGHPLLQATSLRSARGSVFQPTKIGGQPVKVTGMLRYTFSLSR